METAVETGAQQDPQAGTAAGTLAGTQAEAGGDGGGGGREAGRVAVVLGGASGIGRATAEVLAAHGYQVVVADRDGTLAAEVASGLGRPHESATADVTDEASVAGLFDGVHDRLGRLDAVVNSAGIGSLGLIADQSLEEFRAVVDVSLTGGFLVAKHAGRHLGRGGVLVSLSSLNARQPGVGLAAYCSAKAGLSMLTQVAALEFAERGIRVNAIAPGLVTTPLTAPAAAIPGITEDYLANTPLGRAGTPEEIAQAALYLCSDAAAWITGEILDINGGAHMLRYPNMLTHLARAFGDS
ncbi:MULTISPECIES: SDR family NAD(P)-dependent oxidoreductase [unclassified Frankia]|uniref:SDR family NAD(P)-dependent oxidoreductase n=1 Tax=unclassified Frankia TaxID=2632575 RepID=UPI001F2C59B7|nr:MULTISPECIES: SDR family NAD(P)-dependent oxidoreductase [unclassified Frankia]